MHHSKDVCVPANLVSKCEFRAQLARFQAANPIWQDVSNRVILDRSFGIYQAEFEVNLR